MTTTGDECDPFGDHGGLIDDFLASLGHEITTDGLRTEILTQTERWRDKINNEC